jgi:molecular chaperone GrpE (heat shock protein)
MVDDIKSNSTPPDSEPAEPEKHHTPEHHKSKHDKHDHDKHEKKIAELESGIAEKAKAIEEYKDKWLRASADFDNYRKRIIKEKADWHDSAQEEIIAELLPVIDNFDRALASMLTTIPNEHVAFAEGMQLVHKHFIDILTKHKVTAIDCVGKPFDPHFHEAVMTVPTAEYPEDTVVEEIQKGYMHHDKVIRPSMVKVSKPLLPAVVEPVEPTNEPDDTNKNEEELD